MIKFSIARNNMGSTTQDVLVNTNAVYSFGRSTGSSGVHKYKSHWPVVDYPLYYYTNMSDVRKYDWLLKIWGILPFGVSKQLGTHLVKHIY